MARLFLPGPTDVSPEVLQAQAQPMIGHHSAAAREMMARIQPKLAQIFQTAHRVFVSTSSGTGLQEAAVRNGVAERLLVCVCGAFSERWYDVARANGVAAERLDTAWGKPNLPEDVEQALRRSRFDALAVVHNESSTGVENPLAEIAAAARSVYPDILVMVDAVSSLGGVDVRTDAWGLDVVLTSSQKCFGLPPGLAFAAVSDAALTRADSVPNRGWYFDFRRFEAALRRGGTPSTPALSLLFALDRQLDRMLAEGLDARFARHQQMALQVQAWAEQAFSLFAEEGYRSKTVTALRNTRRIDLAALNAFLQEEDMTVADGYGRLQGDTFRIGHMGEIQLSDIGTLLERIDAFLAR